MKRAIFCSLLLVVSACGDTGAESAGSAPLGPGTTAAAPATTVPVTEPAGELLGLALEPVARGLDPVLAMASPPGDPDLYLAHKPGTISVLQDGGLRPFLDIGELVGADELEQGLLGLAFHPDHATNGRFFVYYTDLDGDSVVAEYARSADRADPDSGRVLVVIDQPAGNHNGGMIAFGPDGYLWIGFGDGGGANDQFGHGQRTSTLLGTLARIDVDAAAPYAIPPDNPFAAGGGAPEVWAYGLRNPWRFSFDPVEDLVYVADVGQALFEEVTVVDRRAPGLNYGWSVMEGDDCFGDDECDVSGLVAPTLVYGHDQGCSVIGGHVYRGAAIPELTGHYFYGDWCGRWVRSFLLEDGVPTDQHDWALGDMGEILTFGVDGRGELYVATQDGTVARIAPRR